MKQFNRGGGWLLAMLVVAVGLRLFAALSVVGPWLLPDEGAYSLGYAHGVYQWLAELPSGLVRAVQTLGVCSTGVAVFVWSRRVAGVSWSLGAAALALALPGLAWVAVISPEAVFVPLSTLAGLAGVRALEEPTMRRQVELVALLAACACVLGEANVLAVGVFVAAVVVRRVRVLWRVWAACLVVAAIWVAVVGLAPIRSLGGHTGGGSILGFVLEHGALVVLLSGVVPVCAVGLLAMLRPAELVLRATIAYALASTFVAVIEVGVFAQRHMGQLLEVQLMFVLPPLFVGFAAWLDRGAPRPLLRTLGVVVAAVAALLAVPFGRLAVTGAAPLIPSLVPLTHLGSGRVYGVVALVALAAGVLFVFVRARWIWVLPALVFGVFVAASTSASEEFVDRSQAAHNLYGAPVASWIDRAATAPVTYLYDGQSDWQLAWEQFLANGRLSGTIDLPGTSVAGPLPQRQLELLGQSGLLRLVGGEAPVSGLIVAPQGFRFDGKLVARAPKIGLSLWKIAAPPRVSTWVEGLRVNGDLAQGGVATLTVFGCRAGVFHVVAVGRDNETLRLSENGHPAATTTLWPGGVWERSVDTSGGAGPNAQPTSCTFSLSSSSLVHLSTFAWSPN